MRKYQLLEKAMLDYPKGTKFIGAYEKEFESSGSFRINQKGNVLNNEFGLVYDKSTDKWAEIIKDEPLKVDNYPVVIRSSRELELLIDKTGKEFLANYEGMCANYPESNGVFFINFYDGANNCSFNSQLSQCLYKIIDFDFWAAQNNVDVPRVILTSEDGVELYEGDNYHRVQKGDNWYYAHPAEKLTHTHAVVIVQEHNKAFHSKEAALAWIEKANKPKYITVSQESQFPVDVYSDKIVIRCAGSENHHDNIVIKNDEINQIINAYNSQQPF